MSPSPKSLAVMIGLKKPDMADEDEEMDDKAGDEYAVSEDEIAAGEEAMRAMKEGDGEGFAKAMCALMDLHMSKEDDEEATEERDEAREME